MKKNSKALLIIIAAALLSAVVSLSAGCQAQRAGSTPNGSSVESGQDDVRAGTTGSDSPSTEGERPNGPDGYVGPGDEGAVKGEDYGSNEEYLRALDGLDGGVEAEAEREIAEDPEAGGYARGFLLVTFYRTCSEGDAHSIVESRGGLWTRDSYAIDNGRDTAWASVYFEDAADLAALEKIAEELEWLPEVKYAEPDFAGEASGACWTTSPGTQYYIGQSRFDDAWSVVTCDGGVDIHRPPCHICEKRENR